MQCAVIGCSNQSVEEVGLSEITFHPVPTNAKQREKWLNIIETSKRRSKLYACSLHFNYEDILASGELRPGAVPELLLACRICLAVGRKLYDMTNALEKAYEELTGLTTCEPSSIPQKLCYECARRVLAGREVRTRARRAHRLLTDAAMSHKLLTTDIILSIDRLENNLLSSLAPKYTAIDDFDLIIHEDEQITDKKLNVNLDLDCKDNLDPENIDLKEEINFSDNSIDERSISPELFAEVNNIIVEPVEIKTEKQFKKNKVNRLVRQKEKKKAKKKDDASKMDKRKLKGIKLDESIFEITYLSLEEQLEEIQKRKLSSNFKNSQYKCLVCFKGFGEEDSYTMHMFKHSDKAGLHECEICKIRFKTARDMRTHMVSHTQKFSCKSCPYVTTRRNAARNHENYHNGTVHCCPHCSEQFDKISTYMSHVRIKHPSEFVCELCGNSFVSQKGVVLHKKLKHRLHDHKIPPDAPRCEPCDIRFQNAAALDRHRLLSPKHTSKTSPMRRPRGPNRMRQRDEDNSIMEGPICCEQCDEKLPNAVLYFQHFRRAHPDKNRTNFPSTVRVRPQSMCEVCGRMFQSLALLIDHSHTHTAEKQFSCAQCHKRFQRKYRLVQHLKLHQAVRKTYACVECGKLLSSRSNLHRHSYTHTSLKPFKCEMCGKNFKHASQRREHIAYVHMKKPWPKRNKGERRTVLPQQETSDDDRHQMWPPCE